MKRKTLLSIILLSLSVFFTSCSDKVMGYSVTLWNIPEKQIASGDIVPVYIRSNISHVYVIGTTDGEKIEVPLWQLTEPVKKRKIQKIVAKYQENAHTYASVKLDGLPCRAEPVNTSKQVYRLRKGEVIKILYKGEGQAPMSGKTALEGDWYRILTEDGTTGWCFSYNLKLFETDITGKNLSASETVAEVEKDARWENIVKKVWYPESFKTMIQTGNIDLTKIHPSYKFAFDLENNKVSLNTNTIHENWNYEGYTRTADKEYTLKNISMKIIYKNAGFIVLRYTDQSGKPQDLSFVVIDDDLTGLIAAEKERRSQAYLQVWSHGPVYESSNYGKLTFNEDGVFVWTGFKLLVPSVIEAGTKNSGSASVKYSLGKNLAKNYDGVITMKFDGMQDEVNFLYKIEAGALRLEDTNGAEKNGNQFVSRGSSPISIFFKTINKAGSNFPTVPVN